MTCKTLARTALAAALSLGATAATAQTEVQWWHSMPGALGDWVGGLANGFNASQPQCRVTPTYKGQYDVSMTAAIAALPSTAPTCRVVL